MVKRTWKLSQIKAKWVENALIDFWIEGNGICSIDADTMEWRKGKPVDTRTRRTFRRSRRNGKRSGHLTSAYGRYKNEYRWNQYHQPFMVTGALHDSIGFGVYYKGYLVKSPKGDLAFAVNPSKQKTAKRYKSSVLGKKNFWGAQEIVKFLKAQHPRRAITMIIAYAMPYGNILENFGYRIFARMYDKAYQVASKKHGRHVTIMHNTYEYGGHYIDEIDRAIIMGKWSAASKVRWGQAQNIIDYHA